MVVEALEAESAGLGNWEWEVGGKESKVTARSEMAERVPPVLVSWGGVDTLLQTGWLKITYIYCLTALEARSPHSKCQ